VDDSRFEMLDRKIDGVAENVTTIRDMLISEPAASPLGRALLARDDITDRNVAVLDAKFEKFRTEEFNPIDDWWQQTKGAWRFIIGVGVVLGIVGAFFGVLAFYGVHGGG
jgi:hypothetical protein